MNNGRKPQNAKFIRGQIAKFQAPAPAKKTNAAAPPRRPQQGKKK